MTGEYLLYRLYKNGKRHDLEEQHNIAKDEPKIAKALSEKLEQYIKDYDAKLPYKEPSKFKSDKNVAAIPVITTNTFKAASLTATVQLEQGKSNVIESYALVKISDPVKRTNKGKKKKVRSTYLKVPVNISNNGLEFSYSVPEEAIEYGLILIDENRFMVKSEFQKVK